MRKLFVSIPVVLLLLVISLFLDPSNVLANYQKAYQDYVYNYQVYRNTYNSFQVAKSSYLTYRSLTSQNEAVKAFREVLKSRNQVMIVYYNLLQEKLNATPVVDDATKSTFNNIKESEKSWLGDNQAKIDAAASLEDLNSVSSEFDSRYRQMDKETKQTVGRILLSKEADLKGQVDSQIGTLGIKLTEIRQSGQNTSDLDRGVIAASNKLQLYLEKVNQANDIYFSQSSYNQESIDLYLGQQKLTEANQYLRETVSYLMEIVKGILG